MKINYDNKRFRPIIKSQNSETSTETIFHYSQKGKIIHASYMGGKIISGQLLGLVDEEGNIEMRYHHINDKLELQTGICHSTPEVQNNGKVCLHEKWQWTSGNQSSGESTLIEI